MNDDLKTQLTAWALNELPPDERAAIEARLAGLPEAKAYAEETREFCTLLGQTLAPATETTLTPDQHAELARQFRTQAPAKKVVRSRPAALAWVAGLGAIAAALVLWSGRFLAPPPSPVVVTIAGNEPQSARRSVTSDPSDGSSLFDVDVKLAHFADGADTLDHTRGLAELARVEVAQGLSVAQNTALDSPEALRAHSANFGLNSASPEATPTDSLSSTRGFGGQTEPEKAKNALLADLSVDEGLIQRDASGLSAAGAPATLAQLSPTTAPAAPERPDTLSQKLNPSASTKEGALGLVADGEGEAAGIAATRNRRWAAKSDFMTDLATKPELSRVESKGLEEQKLRGAIAGTRPFGTEAAPAPGGAGPDAFLLAEQLTTQLLSKEAAVEKRTEPLASYYFRYVIPTPPESTAESYAALPENPFKAVAAEPRSTFSIDVDTAAYANVRRFLNQGQRPPQPAVRIEEMVNYFRYDYPQPEAGKPFSVTVDLTDCPWQPQHRLARVGLKGREVAADKRPQSNLVFLIDVSGSMDEPNKLPLVQNSLRMLSSQLGDKDRVAMVTYAGDSGLALDSTSGADRAKIGTAIDRLVAGGSTNGASGIQLAYDVAQRNFVKEGVNRVLLATDGDFNVGVTSQEALQKLITNRAKGGVFLSVLGYGMGNLKDSTMEMLADKGNGNYAYIDSLSEARKVLGEEMSGTLVTIAKDVKIQIEFNSAFVRDYRLLGYENRMLAKEDFNNDKKDAGEIGAGHTVTALYELVPVGAPAEVPLVDGLKYAPPPILAAAVPAEARKPIDPAIARQTMTVKLRYKAPDGDTSQMIEVEVVDKEAKFVEAPADFKFAASVTMFGMLLKDSAHKGTTTWDQVRQFALQGKGPDPLGYRGEFIQLIDKARGVAP